MVRELERENRIVSFRLTIPDRPGVLGVIATRFGQLGANILEVDHRRLFLDVPAKGAKLDVTVETRDAAHAEEIHRALAADGYLPAADRGRRGRGGKCLFAHHLIRKPVPTFRDDAYCHPLVAVVESLARRSIRSAAPGRRGAGAAVAVRRCGRARRRSATVWAAAAEPGRQWPGPSFRRFRRPRARWRAWLPLSRVATARPERARRGSSGHRRPTVGDRTRSARRLGGRGLLRGCGRRCRLGHRRRSVGLWRRNAARRLR